jgi:hypothetical protein
VDERVRPLIEADIRDLEALRRVKLDLQSQP